MITLGEKVDNIIDKAIGDIVQAHDLDFERLWLTFNKTDQLVTRLTCQGTNPVQSRIMPTSTITSSIKRLVKKGYIIRLEKDKYTMEDPFFRRWIILQQ